jgi:hypothetical protein
MPSGENWMRTAKSVFGRVALAAIFGLPGLALSSDVPLVVSRSSENNDDVHFLAATKAAKSGGPMSQVIEELSASLDDGSFNFISLKYSSDFSMARRDENWQRVVAVLQRKSHWVGELDRLMSLKDSPEVQGILADSIWLRRGTMDPKTLSIYRQYAGASYTLVGDYYSAAAAYPNIAGVRDPRARGYTVIEPVFEEILHAAAGRRAVFLNESHGRGETRAFNFMLATALFNTGITHLSLEGIGARSNEIECSDSSLLDSELHVRGYPTASSGYYSNDPLMGELIRIAISKGVRIVAHTTGDGRIAQDAREQVQADKIACIFDENPAARVVAIGGFSHISEKRGLKFPEGLMGRRFSDATGIDPLTIDTTFLLDSPGIADASKLRSGWTAYSYRKPTGERYSIDGFDYVVALPPATSRALSSVMLKLGSYRQAIVPTGVTCNSPPCVFSARRVDETEDAVPADRCVTRSSAGLCPLYLPCGEFRIESTDRNLNVSHSDVLVSARQTCSTDGQ